MITEKNYDAVVIGAGAAGMAAAAEICASGRRAALIDREEHLGGILLQCIHNGFGLHHFKEELTGPEYAERCAEKLPETLLDTFLETTVIDITESESGANEKIISVCSALYGVMELHAKAVVLAMGCRERNRGNIGIPGARPSGIFTAGLAQRLLNIEGCLPGRRVVIVGSGDIGMIMARRLSWSGAEVLCVVEIQPYPSGLTRNIVQCLEDFSIPLHLSHTVSRILGNERVEGVEIAPLVNGIPDMKKSFARPCDTVLLSVGLIPENELSKKAGVAINPDTNGPVVDHHYQTSVDGIFACGNVLHVHDLADYVSEEAGACGRSVAAWLEGKSRAREPAVRAEAGPNVKYVVPSTCLPGVETRFLMRAMVVSEQAELVVRRKGTVVHSRKLRRVRPAEMLSVTIAESETEGLSAGDVLEFSIRLPGRETSG